MQDVQRGNSTTITLTPTQTITLYWPLLQITKDVSKVLRHASSVFSWDNLPNVPKLQSYLKLCESRDMSHHQVRPHRYGSHLLQEGCCPKNGRNKEERGGCDSRQGGGRPTAGQTKRCRPTPSSEWTRRRTREGQ